MKKILFLSILTMSLTSCNANGYKPNGLQDTLKEGRLIYSVSGEGTTSDWKLEVLFNQEAAVINEHLAGSVNRKYMLDKKSNEILGLFDDAEWSEDGPYLIYFTPEELILSAMSSNYGDESMTATQEFKNIMGYRCQKSVIKHGDQATVEVWLTDQIKPGIIYPWTPLSYEKIALEYELKILGVTDRKYTIQSISEETIDKKEFEHIVPDPYSLVVPVSSFSLKEIWTRDYKENAFKSFSYPYYLESRDATLKILKKGIYTIVPEDENTVISIDFLINQNGLIEELEVAINFQSTDKRIRKIKEFILNMGSWTPGKVKGRPVSSRVKFFA